jgi:hypothetical protein
MPDIDFVAYYNLEQYLFECVRPRFDQDHSLGAFDFFSIIIWKANRAKSKIAKRLWECKTPDENDLEMIVRRLTSTLYETSDNYKRLRLLLDRKNWRFRLPMASAILTVLWPEIYSVYDVRVTHQLKAFKDLANCTNVESVVEAYFNYVEAVKLAVPEEKTLRDKDRYLWARSTAEQLKQDIKSRFKTTLSKNSPRGTRGSDLLEFAGCITKEDAELMIKAIEDGCEKIDYETW